MQIATNNSDNGVLETRFSRYSAEIPIVAIQRTNNRNIFIVSNLEVKFITFFNTAK